VPASFEDQLAIAAELLREVERMEAGERRWSKARPPAGYERELRLAGLAQRVAQAYTIQSRGCSPSSPGASTALRSR
jgi:hypothetical protein